MRGRRPPAADHGQLARARPVAGLSRRPVRHRLAGRSGGGAPRRHGRTSRAPALCPQPCGLLHLVDLLWRHRPRGHRRLRFPVDLCRADPDDRSRLADPRQDGTGGQGRERCVDFRFHLGALRQKPGAGGAGHRDRGGRGAALFRPAAQGDHHQFRGPGRQPLRRHGHARPARADHPAGHRDHGRLRHSLRRSQHPCQRAPPRADERDFGRNPWSSWPPP